ncbi:MAG: hypothetical protein CR982_08710 [Candidatus Cloacimonadota bacterium]|nr:MAG: hypothetical protein CR982_08710 [Candidatus Cloacimonadota bacterium]PIE77715.1 MAG: hypothetical protein CSA15_11365 [Candidatus Delongbacteria bacterium]
MKKVIKSILNPIVESIGKFFYPDINSENISFYILMRYIFFQKIISVNKNVPWPVHSSSIVLAPERIENNGSLPGYTPASFIDGRNGIKIGKNCWLGPKISIISMDHDNYNFSEYVEDKPIIIGNDCLLTTNCVILPGVELGDHTIVAAGAVVTKSFPKGNQIIGGNPAKVIKEL